MFISGQEKLRELESEGKIEAAELEATAPNVEDPLLAVALAVEVEALARLQL